MKIYLLTSFCFFFAICSYAQKKEISQLNEHYWQVNKGTGTHVYNSVKQIFDQKEEETILTLENIPIEISKTTFKDSERKKIQNQEKKRFDTLGNLVAVEVLDNSSTSSILRVFDAQKLVLILDCMGSDCLGEFYPSSRTDTLDVDRDIFKPRPVGGVDAWNNFLIKNLRYPGIARSKKLEGEVWVGARISAAGELMEVTAMNPNQVDQTLIEEVYRIFEIYSIGFLPALDFTGNPIEAWFYLPIRFELG